MQSLQFSKNFPLPKNGKFVFCHFCKNSKIQNGRHFWGGENFWKIAKLHSLDTLWVENFDEIALSRTVKEIEANLCFAMANITKHKFASISLTVRDRAISSKFSTHRVSKECNLCNFPKIFPSPKMAAILNFRIFAKNGKTQICFYLLNRAR